VRHKTDAQSSTWQNEFTGDFLFSTMPSIKTETRRTIGAQYAGGKMKRLWQGIATLACAALLPACAVPKVEEVLGIDATIVNYTNKPIARVLYQLCGTTPEAWQPLRVPQLETGQFFKLRLPASCVDLNAYTDDGKVAGTQRHVQTQFPFQWAIK